MFEVIARNKTRHPVKADAVFSYQTDKMQILMQNVHDTKFVELVQSEEFVEFLQLKGDLTNFLNIILIW